MGEVGGGADALLARRAHTDPDRLAVRASYADLTFADLDTATDSCAAALRGLLGAGRHRVAVATPLHPDVIVALHGTLRSGNVAVPVAPFASAAALEHALRAADVELAFVTTELLAVLRTVRHRLPRLREAVLLGPGPKADANEIRTIDDLSAAYEVHGLAMAPPRIEPGDPACVQFTSGTTGAPKGAVLSHRNLLANAAQVARAHRLHTGSVVLNHLPKYHLMHLNSGLAAGALQVPHGEPDIAASARAAADSGATHYYSIPMRLTRLARDPALADVRMPPLEMIGSGGTALPVPVARELTERFGVPVLQGYGLAEASPLTHSAGPADPRPGTVGPPVADTECRVVDLATGAPVADGGRGHVRVRGPQVMLGYLDGSDPGIDADGWLATGDVGYVEPGGALVLVDRLKDFFKVDNEIVAPSQLEDVIGADPAVRECAVVGYPDQEHGHVVAAVVVPADRSGGRTARERTLAALRDTLAAALPGHLRPALLVSASDLPRSANAKVARRELLAELVTRRELAPPPGRGSPRERSTIMADEQDLTKLVAVVARFTAADPEAFEEKFLEHVEWMRRRPGFGAHQAVRLVADPSVFVNVGWWIDAESYQAVAGSEEFRHHLQGMRSTLAGAQVDVCTNLYRVNADEEAAGARADFGTPRMQVVTYRPTGTATEFEDAFARYAAVIRRSHGFGYGDLNRSIADPGSYTGLLYWWEPAAADRATSGDDYRALLATADVHTEEVTHVAWNRAYDESEQPAAS